mmetsp:Transcript_26939/g.70802  ORF Transcript_26939/g.70802 Transcript_26939/m.70802 type:complete len:153 (+) Transcript_26939:52-510(+)|eukprot:CAMPEP_0182924828 /NCGR_PEP_ID=MMETSP0105_2-20130417/7659_1 /TAXON_ID=81532 ORGANISM="Acanthoeca-like sp., Strain 10tr" /NCGR_SAMPLE_ID=MMETSP0105_2 /ASSEMBLY_ACC=CAM_ASM_000205 /LENGTH=152 /DNA_ID=CAMNT_0025062641 /DNA_START=52 /DNA_END=510 /DNA_ORIENTATION=+
MKVAKLMLLALMCAAALAQDSGSGSGEAKVDGAAATGKNGVGKSMGKHKGPTVSGTVPDLQAKVKDPKSKKDKTAKSKNLSSGAASSRVDSSANTAVLAVGAVAMVAGVAAIVSRRQRMQSGYKTVTNSVATETSPLMNIYEPIADVEAVVV